MKKLGILMVFALLLNGCQNTTKDENKNETSKNSDTKDTTLIHTEEPMPSSMVFPEGFRDWHHIKSMILQKGHALYDNFGGIHHIYANDKAYEGYQNNKQFPDGSVIVFDLLEANNENNAIVEGKRKVIGVMYKNSKVFNETGGWEFGAYKDFTGQKVEMDWKASCFSCHASKKDVDYVFSEYRK